MHEVDEECALHGSEQGDAQDTRKLGNSVGVAVQMTHVRKRLASVGQMCEAGSRVAFEDESGGRIARQISRMKTELSNENGVYEVTDQRIGEC